jgi:hypothetical protein
MEMLGGLFDEQHGVRSLAGTGILQLQSNMFATVEESLEMAGAILFIWSLLKLLEERYQELRIRFSSATTDSLVDSAAPISNTVTVRTFSSAQGAR